MQDVCRHVGAVHYQRATAIWISPASSARHLRGNICDKRLSTYIYNTIKDRNIITMAQPSIGAQASRLAKDFTLKGTSRTRMPKLVYGTAWKKDTTAKLVYTALKTGFRGIDTAAQPKHYNEPGVAAGFKQALSEGLVKREDIYVRTFTPGHQGPVRTRLTIYLLDSNKVHSTFGAE